MKRTACTAVAVCGTLGGACSPTAGAPTDVVAAAVQAVGGTQAIHSLVSETFSASGEQFDPGQGVVPGDTRSVSTYTLNVTRDYANDRLRQEWNVALLYPEPSLGPLAFTEIADGTLKQGFIDGTPGILPGTTSPGLMYDGRLGAVLEESRLSAPLRLLQTASMKPSAAHVESDQIYDGRPHHVVTLSDGALPVRLFIDASTDLISKVETVEDDPILGDTTVEVVFGDWRGVNTTKFPFALTYEVQGHVVRDEQRRSVRLNASLPADTFTVPTTPPVPFLAQGSDGIARGERASHWFLAGRAFGAPHDFDYAVSVPVIANLNTTVAPGVFYVREVSHNAMVVEMADHLIVVEAPVNEDASQAVLAKLREKWPDKPVRYVISTHFHEDHAGGLRAYGAAGATVLTSSVNQEYLTDVFAAPHTVDPDALQSSGTNVPIRVVAEKTVLTDGTRNVEIYSIDDLHVQGSLIAYLPAEQVVFSSDLVSPGGFDPNVVQPDPAYAYPSGVFKQNALYLLHVVLPELGIEPQIFVGGHGTFGSLAQIEQSVR
jgi:glyoxylase-like metal-dependent hydrolase (beta-lactamase superfamily II)